MKVIASNIQSSFTIKKSKFLTFAYRVNDKDEVKTYINQIKKKYPDASHICYAYVLDDATYYFTDGGEPSGTAGKPIYGAIQSFKLNYILLVVVRYFGGIKFGTGPLRSTFKDVAKQTLEQAKLINCAITDVIQITIPYDKVKKITSFFRTSIINQTFKKEYVVINIAGNKNDIISKLKSFNIKSYSVKENQVV